MSKSIFDPSVNEKLSNLFTEMSQPRQTAPVVTEQVVAKKKVITEGLDEEVAPYQDAPMGEFEGGVEDDLDILDGDEEEGFDDVGEMIEVPRELLDQLISYLEDPMDEEEPVEVDDVDFEIPEESIEYSTLKSLFANTTQTGTPKQKGKTKVSKGGGVHTGVGGKERTGKAEVLKSILKSYLKQTTKATVNTKWSVGQQAVAK